MDGDKIILGQITTKKAIRLQLQGSAEMGNPYQILVMDKGVKKKLSFDHLFVANAPGVPFPTIYSCKVPVRICCYIMPHLAPSQLSKLSGILNRMYPSNAMESRDGPL